MTVSIHPSGSYTGVSYKASTETSIHNLLNSASCTLHAPLKSNLFLSRGTGAATWSRATAAWRFNELGYLEQIATGGAVFLGARNVTNQLRNIATLAPSEDLTVAGWTKENGTTTPTATTFVCANASGVQHRLRSTNSLNLQAGRILRLSGRFTYVDHPYIQLRLVSQLLPWGYVNLNLQTGATFNYGDVLASGSSFVSGTTYDFWADFKAPTDLISNAVYIINFISSETATSGPTFTGDGIKSIGLTRMSIVDVTNYPRTYNPEYVSVGVLSTPWHGGGADGVKYFETDYNGNIIPDNDLLGFRREVSATNNLRYSRDLSVGASSAGTNTWFSVGQGSELLTNGDFSGGLTSWTNSSTGTGSATVGGGGIVLLGTDALNRGAITQGVSGLVIGKEYSLQVDISSYTSGTLTISLSSSQGTIGTTYTSNSSSGTKTQMFTATATTMYVSFHSGASGGSMTIDNISFKESGIQSSLTVTGLDGVINTATTLTAIGADATILQPITLASAARCSSAYVKRRTGIGTISFTQDGGSTWTDITSQINSNTWTRVQITSTLTNPVVGFKITTSGDEVEVDCVQLESGAIATSPIVTTSATVTRNTDSLTYPTASNIDFTVGSAFLETMHQGSLINTETAFGTTVAILYRSNTTPVTSYRVYDGTNIVQKDSLSDVSTGVRKRAASWGTSLKVCGDGASPTFGSFDGSLPSDVSFGVGSTSAGSAVLNGTVKNVAIFNYEFSDSELQGITS